jgi:hypothetical protein
MVTTSLQDDAESTAPENCTKTESFAQSLFGARRRIQSR